MRAKISYCAVLLLSHALDMLVLNYEVVNHLVQNYVWYLPIFSIHYHFCMRRTKGHGSKYYVIRTFVGCMVEVGGVKADARLG